MLFPINFQVNMFIYSFIAGILTGILFDIYRIIRGFKKHNNFFDFVEDILFWILAALIIYIFLLYTSEGLINAYIYIFVFLGLYVYIKLISRLLIKVQYSIIIRVLKLIRVIKNLIVYPFQLLFHKIFEKNKKNKYK